MQQVRQIGQVKVYRRDAKQRRTFASEMSEALGVDVRPVDSARDAVREVDIILAATNAGVPVFDGNWLKPRQHVTSIVGSNVSLVEGGFTPKKRREIDDATLVAMDLIVAASRDQAIQDQQGNLYDPVQNDVISLEQIHDLGDVLTGKLAGGGAAGHLTLFKNNAGQGIADVAIAAKVYARARERELGMELALGAWKRRS